MSILLKNDADTLESIKEFVDCYDDYFLGRNQWFYGNIVNIYMRNTHRHFAGDYFRTVEIGAVSVVEKYRGQGVYRELLDWMYNVTPIGAALFVEGVLDSDHYGIYTRRNFAQYGSVETTGTVSFIKVRH